MQKKQHKISLRGNYHFLVWIEASKDVKNTFQTIQAINDYSKFIKLMKLTITKDNIFFLHPNEQYTGKDLTKTKSKFDDRHVKSGQYRNSPTPVFKTKTGTYIYIY